MAPGAITPRQAVRIGGPPALHPRGPEWRLARLLAALGAPMPEHIHELLHRGRTADGGRALETARCVVRLTTQEVVKALYEWATVILLRPGEVAA